MPETDREDQTPEQIVRKVELRKIDVDAALADPNIEMVEWLRAQTPEVKAETKRLGLRRKADAEAFELDRAADIRELAELEAERAAAAEEWTLVVTVEEDPVPGVQANEDVNTEAEPEFEPELGPDLELLRRDFETCYRGPISATGRLCAPVARKSETGYPTYSTHGFEEWSRWVRDVNGSGNDVWWTPGLLLKVPDAVKFKAQVEPLFQNRTAGFVEGGWAVSMDIDWSADERHKSDNLAVESECVQVLRHFVVPPTIVRRTGGGLHVSWVFKYRLEREELVRCGVLLDIHGKAAFGEMWNDGHGSTLHGLLRPAGSISYKAGRRVLVIIDEELSTSEVYSLPQFLAVVETAEVRDQELARAHKARERREYQAKESDGEPFIIDMFNDIDDAAADLINEATWSDGTALAAVTGSAWTRTGDTENVSGIFLPAGEEYTDDDQGTVTREIPLTTVRSQPVRDEWKIGELADAERFVFSNAQLLALIHEVKISDGTAIASLIHENYPELSEEFGRRSNDWKAERAGLDKIVAMAISEAEPSPEEPTEALEVVEPDALIEPSIGIPPGGDVAEEWWQLFGWALCQYHEDRAEFSQQWRSSLVHEVLLSGELDIVRRAFSQQQQTIEARLVADLPDAQVVLDRLEKIGCDSSWIEWHTAVTARVEEYRASRRAEIKSLVATIPDSKFSSEIVRVALGELERNESPSLPPLETAPMATRAQLEAALAGEGLPELVILPIGDVALFYAPATNMIWGPSGHGKTWIAHLAAAIELIAGRSVVFVDPENNLASVLRRLRLLGVPPDVLTDPSMLRWLNVQNGGLAQIEQSMRELHVDGGVLVVVDGYERIRGLWFGDRSADSNTVAADVLSWFDLRANAYELGVILIDHVTIAASTGVAASDNAMGAGHKKNQTTGVAYDVRRLIVDEVLVYGQQSETRLLMTAKKNRGADPRVAEEIPIVMRLTFVPSYGDDVAIIAFSLEDAPVNLVNPTLGASASDEAMELLDQIKFEGPRGLTGGELGMNRKPGGNIGQKERGQDRKKYEALLGELVEAGLAVRLDSGKWGRARDCRPFVVRFHESGEMWPFLSLEHDDILVDTGSWKRSYEHFQNGHSGLVDEG